MAYNRRHFLRAAGSVAAAGLILPSISCSNSTNSEGSSAAEGQPLSDFGVQLYSVRDLIEADPKGVMTQLAKLGFTKFESYAGKQGFLWGMTPAEYSSFMGEIGVNTMSTHCDTTKDLQKSIDEAAAAGLSYLLQPWIGPQETIDDWKRRAEEFNERGELCAKAGLKFGYHNHDYSFKTQEGQVPQEILLENTDPNRVIFELDLCWIEAAGMDTVAHLTKYAGRYQLVHVKDLVRKPEPHSTDLGTGEIDFTKILAAASASGVSQFIFEQEHYPESVMKSMGLGAEYLKGVRI